MRQYNDNFKYFIHLSNNFLQTKFLYFWNYINFSYQNKDNVAAFL